MLNVCVFLATVKCGNCSVSCAL